MTVQICAWQWFRMPSEHNSAWPVSSRGKSAFTRHAAGLTRPAARACSSGVSTGPVVSEGSARPAACMPTAPIRAFARASRFRDGGNESRSIGSFVWSAFGFSRLGGSSSVGDTCSFSSDIVQLYRLSSFVFYIIVGPLWGCGNGGEYQTYCHRLQNLRWNLLPQGRQTRYRNFCRFRSLDEHIPKRPFRRQRGGARLGDGHTRKKGV